MGEQATFGVALEEFVGFVRVDQSYQLSGVVLVEEVKWPSASVKRMSWPNAS